MKSVLEIRKLAINHFNEDSIKGIEFEDECEVRLNENMNKPNLNNKPTNYEIREYMKDNPHHSYYTARERLREIAYSRKYSKAPWQSWGDYWKTF